MSERVGFEKPTRPCDTCGAPIKGTPWAKPLMDLRFDECLRFCSERCCTSYGPPPSAQAGEGDG